MEKTKGSNVKIALEDVSYFSIDNNNTLAVNIRTVK